MTANARYPLQLADTHMPGFLSVPITMVSASGITLSDSNGKQYIDLFSGNWNTPLGYSQNEIKSAIFTQLERLPFAKASSFANDAAFQLAETLTQLVPVDSPRCIFSNSGSEAVEVAIKLVRQKAVLEKTKKTEIVVFDKAYHGLTIGALSATGIKWCKEPFEPLAPGFYHIKTPVVLDDVDFVSELFKSEPGIGAIMVEPVLGVGGVISLPDGYLEILRQICNECDILLICDEITTGMGRCGEWFCSTACKPDILLIGKALTNGYVPLSATIANAAVWNSFDSNGLFRHGQTNTNHPVCAAAGVATIDVLQRIDAPVCASEKAAIFRDALLPLAEKGRVVNVRGKGLLMAIDIELAVHLRQRNIKWLQEGMLRRGFVVGQVDNTVILAPPFITEKCDFLQFVDTLNDLLDTEEV